VQGGALVGAAGRVYVHVEGSNSLRPRKQPVICQQVAGLPLLN